MNQKITDELDEKDLLDAVANADRLEHQIDELTELLKINRELSQILDPQELYSVLGDTIVKKVNARTFSVFVFHRNTQTFQLDYRHGYGKENREFQYTDVGSFWDELLKNHPFSVYDVGGQPQHPDIVAKYHLDELDAGWVIPLMMRTNVIGFLAIGNKENGESFTDYEMMFLQQIAEHAAVCINTSHFALKRKKEKEELDRTLHNLSLLYNIGRAMTYISDLKSLLEYILNQAIQITGAEKGSIMLYDIEKNLLTIRVLAGLKDRAYQKKVNNNEVECKSFRPGEGIAGRVFQTGRPIVVDEARENSMFIDPDTSYVRNIACIPMLVYSDVIGVINVTNKLDNSGFSDVDMELLKAVTDQAAVAINKAQLWEMAVTDSLTGLFVRRYFMAKFQEELHRAERYKKLLSVVMVDLDHFKKVNDTYGHTDGDRALNMVARFLQNNLRDIDIIGRYGGEEFVILLPEADKEEAYLVSERLRKQLAELKDEDLPQMTISLGIASYPDDGANVELLIRKADTAMYEAKQAGRNKVVIYSDDLNPAQPENNSQNGSLNTATQ